MVSLGKHRLLESFLRNNYNTEFLGYAYYTHSWQRGDVDDAMRCTQSKQYVFTHIPEVVGSSPEALTGSNWVPAPSTGA